MMFTKRAEKNIRRKSKLPYFIFMLLIIAIVITTTYFIDKNKKKEREPETVTVTQLYKIVNASQLSTYQCTYNDICIVYNEEKPENIDFYCAYEAKVKAGIDFKNIQITKDEDKMKYIVTIPQVTLEEPEVDIGTLDYMFENSKAETNDVSERAYKACCDDVKNKAEKETAIYDLAAKNAQNTVKALVNPFLEQLGDGYTLEIDMKEVK